LKNHELYENDFFGWAMLNAQLLREHRLAEIDAENIAEELEGLTRTEKRHLVNKMSNLIISLIRWDVQPGLQCGRVMHLIEIQRLDVKEVLQDCPSLMEQMNKILEDAYKKAHRGFIDITGFDERSLSETCPYTLNQILDAEIAFEAPELPQDLLDFVDSIPESIQQKARLMAQRDLGMRISNTKK